MKIITKSKKGTDFIMRTENIEINNISNLENEVREYNNKHYGEKLLECGLYQEFNITF